MDWDHLWKAGAKMLSQVNNPKKLLINPPPGPPPIDSNASGTSVELLSVMSFWHLQLLGRARRGPFVYVRARRGLFVYVRARCACFFYFGGLTENLAKPDTNRYERDTCNVWCRRVGPKCRPEPLRGASRLFLSKTEKIFGF